MFQVNHQYTKKDIYDVLGVPKERQAGNWNTGYTSYDNHSFIFANVDTISRTGHDHNNHFHGEDLIWYGKKGSHPAQPSIQKLTATDFKTHLFVRRDSSNTAFIYLGEVVPKKIEGENPVKIIWCATTDLEEDVSESEQGGNNSSVSVYREGKTKRASVNIYERNPLARAECLNYYGYNCVVCDFNFERVYGEIGKNYIHVHHLYPLKDIGNEHEVHPIKDLRPVCPNCHAMLHKKRDLYSIEELQAILNH
ncbi:5-methylcytosine-specific restriction protein A [Salsuginibacillus halophilus]|uniref:5-methylcytosine-specific restriction protein A n=1 Tax=Salsuginibacillus halophilus TaxID=517424 RepID=A0A2P8H4Y2_9BACI|nr:DUF3427 domain-containing protein [Salsuginibacillus halophilus]PSL41277.1 5-methylcytosine-specific restriction protein A [Salsuginibacillus halophilus]